MAALQRMAPLVVLFLLAACAAAERKLITLRDSLLVGEKGASVACRDQVGGGPLFPLVPTRFNLLVPSSCEDLPRRSTLGKDDVLLLPLDDDTGCYDNLPGLFRHLESSSLAGIVMVLPSGSPLFGVNMTMLLKETPTLPSCAVSYEAGQELVSETRVEVTSSFAVPFVVGASGSVKRIKVTTDKRQVLVSEDSAEMAWGFAPVDYTVLVVAVETDSGPGAIRLSAGDGLASSTDGSWWCKMEGAWDEAPPSDPWSPDFDPSSALDWWQAKDAASAQPKWGKLAEAAPSAWISVGGHGKRTICRATKPRARLQVGSFEWTVSQRELSFGDAEAACVKEGGHLVSVHTASEELALKAFVAGQRGTNTPDGAWVGLNTMAEQYWTDGSPSDYFVPHAPEGDSPHCVLVGTLWQPARCSDRHAFVCATRDDSRGAEMAEQDKCLVFLEEGPFSFDNLGRPPIVDSQAGDTCVFGEHGQISCCSSAYMRAVVEERYKSAEVDFDAGAKSKCGKVLREATCFDCMANQGHYLRMDSDSARLVLHVCESTCVSLFQACGGGSGPKPVFESANAMCETLFNAWGGINGSMSTELKIVDSGDSNRRDCFQIDGTPPQIQNLHAKPQNSEVFFQFTEPVRLAFPLVRLSGSSGKVREYRPGDAVQFSLRTSTFANDTLHVSFLFCAFPEGDFRVELAKGSVADNAGNLVQGASTIQATSSTSCYEQSFLGVQLLGASVVAATLVFGISSVRRSRMSGQQESLQPMLAQQRPTGAQQPPSESVVMEEATYEPPVET